MIKPKLAAVMALTLCCAYCLSGAPRILTPAEQAVKFYGDTQQETMMLKEKCKEMPGLLQLPADDYALRSTAVSMQKNAVQILYGSYSSTTHNFVSTSSSGVDAKFWSCP